MAEQAEDRRTGNNAQEENILEGEGYPWAKYVFGWTDEHARTDVSTGPYMEIDRKTRMLENLDALSEIKARSLWSGGSAGTNGVDEFVWDDDEDGFVGDAEMLDTNDIDNQERQRLKKEYQRQQMILQQQYQHHQQQIHFQQAVDERFMRDEEVKRAIEEHRRRYQRATGSGSSPRAAVSSRQAEAQATPPQLKAYTSSFFSKHKVALYQQTRQLQTPSSPSQQHSRPGTSGSGSGRNSHVEGGYKRQSIGRGIQQSGKTGSFGSVDGAVFRMDGEAGNNAMDVDTSSPTVTQTHHVPAAHNFTGAGLPLPSSYFSKPPAASAANKARGRKLPPLDTTAATISHSNNAAAYHNHNASGYSTPSYTNPTFSSLGKARPNKSPLGQKAMLATPLQSPTPMDKGLREYMEALRRYEVRCAADAEVTAEGTGVGDSRRRRRTVAGTGYY